MLECLAPQYLKWGSTEADREVDVRDLHVVKCMYLTDTSRKRPTLCTIISFFIILCKADVLMPLNIILFQTIHIRNMINNNQ